MPWYAWGLLGAFVFNLYYTWHIVDRPRSPKTAREAWYSTIELGLYAWAVVALAHCS